MGSLRRKSYTRPLPVNAELFTKKGEQFARWKDANGKKHTAATATGKDGSVKIIIRSGKWLAKFRDENGAIQEVSTGCRDKQAASAALVELERRAERIRSGVLTASEDAIARHSTAPIAEHFDTYREHRVARELNAVRIKNADSRLKRLADECGFRKLSDLTGEAMSQWLGLQLELGMGPGTRNEYLKEVVTFGNWCVRTGRLNLNPFASIPRANAKADCRRKRRALDEQELEKLLYVARWRPLAEYGRETVPLAPNDSSKRSKWKKAPITLDTLEGSVKLARQRLMDNPDFARKLDQRGRERALVYRTLVLTGLRRGELASLTVGAIALDETSPYAILAAGDEKNRKGSEIPLRADLVAELREWIADKRKAFSGSSDEFSQQPLFSVPASLLKVLNRDLAAAGIPKTDSRGRTVDVHAMRMTLATMLNKSGVAPRTAQEIMRHSDIRLTMENYTDARLLNVSGALDSLPELAASSTVEDHLEVVQVTGTAGALPPILPPDSVHTRYFELSGVTLTGGIENLAVETSGSATNQIFTKKGLSEGNSDKPCQSGRHPIV